MHHYYTGNRELVDNANAQHNKSFLLIIIKIIIKVIIVIILQYQ